VRVVQVDVETEIWPEDTPCAPCAPEDAPVDERPAVAAPPRDETGPPATLDREDLNSYWPFFIVSHTVFVFGLWAVTALKERDTTAGLETIFPGQTLLSLHRDCEDLRFQIYRWLSYQYTHKNAAHIFTNSVYALGLGIPLARFQNSYRMAIVFEAGVFGGAMGFLVSNGHAKSLMGMSGGCYSLLGFRFADLVVNWAETRYRWCVVGFMLLVCVSEIVNVQALQNEKGEGGFVSYSSHVGGLVAGLLLGMAISRNIKDGCCGCEKFLRVLAFMLGLFFTAFCIAWTISWPTRTLWDLEPWCWARVVANETVFGDVNWHCVRCADDVDCIQYWSSHHWVEKVNPAFCDRAGGWDFTGLP